MPNYKDPGGNVHFIEEDKHKNLLPVGCVKISESEVEEINAAKAKVEEDKGKVEKDKVDLLWQEFDGATTVASLKTVLKKILNS